MLRKSIVQNVSIANWSAVPRVRAIRGSTSFSSVLNTNCCDVVNQKNGCENSEWGSLSVMANSAGHGTDILSESRGSLRRRIANSGSICSSRNASDWINTKTWGSIHTWNSRNRERKAEKHAAHWIARQFPLRTDWLSYSVILVPAQVPEEGNCWFSFANCEQRGITFACFGRAGRSTPVSQFRKMP